MSNKCLHCEKTVYHAEKREHDGKLFHARCFNLWKKATEEAERDRKNRENYDVPADVTPAYYRVGDVTTGEPARMVVGTDIPKQGRAASSEGGAPKFCPECGAQNTTGKFCGECGFRF